MKPVIYFILLATAYMLAACSERDIVIEQGDLSIRFNTLLHSQVSFKPGQAKPLMDNFSASEYLVTRDETLKDFVRTQGHTLDVNDSIGKGKRWVIKGVFDRAPVKMEKIVTVTVYERFPGQAFYNVAYINRSDRGIDITRWVNHHYKINPHPDSIPFWSFQGQSTGARGDWVLPVKPGFFQRNFMGMNNTDYGGGIPVVDLWRPDQGIAVGHAETQPKLVSLPVELNKDENLGAVQIQFDYDNWLTLEAGDTLTTYETFVSVHRGDYYTTLKDYGKILRAKGIDFAEPQEESFKASWCAWGYMREFTLDEIRNTIPKVKQLGIEWVTIDDGYQQAEGDWHVTRSKFRHGDTDMKALVDELHSQGLKVMLWWAPLAADPGSDVLRNSPDLKLLTPDGAPQYITWWDAYYLAPGYEKTRQYTREVLDLFFNQWGIDGLKMDGQHLNAAPPDFDETHHLTSPEKSFEEFPAFYKMIYEEANKMKPGSIVQNCPCGTCMSVFNMPYMNQAVASDPLNSWQIRLKGKTYKAIIPETAYFGDHVELSDNRNDFATSFGIGAVLGTKFTWPKENPFVKEDNLLTPEKEITWRKWLSLYQSKMLSKAEYRGDLYDIGYDIPEAHVIAKGDTLHYAFYNKQWKGLVEFKGLREGTYTVRDYVNKVTLGEVSQQNPRLDVAFEKNLLVEAYPVN
jgi:alpha-galactosidase